MVLQVPEGIPYRGHSTIAVLVIFCVTAIAFVGLRLYSRVKLLKQSMLGWTDWLIIVSTFAMFMFAALQVFNMLNYGLGVHMKDFHKVFGHDYIETYVTLRKIAITQRIFYEISTCLIKFSILLFLLTLSPYRSFHLLIYILMFLDVALALSSILMVLLQCFPLRAAFFPPSRRPPGSHCAFEWFVTTQALPICNAVLDALCWLVPMYLAWHVSATMERLRVAVVLCMGLTAVIACIVRIVILKRAIDAGDPTWYLLDIGVCAVVELALSIICACCPVLMPVIRLINKKLRGLDSTQQSSRASAAARQDLENIEVELHSGPNFRKIGHITTDASSILDDHDHENMPGLGARQHWDGDGARISRRTYYASTEAFADASSTRGRLSGASSVAPSLDANLNHGCNNADVKLGSGGSDGRRGDLESGLGGSTA